MRYPCLIPKHLCKTEITLSLDREGISEYGEPFDPIVVKTCCNYQDGAQRHLTSEKVLIELSGRALFPGDICPELPVISGGSAVIFGEERQIQSGRKARNPDGTVNYTEVLFQ